MISKRELLRNWKLYPVLVDSLFPDGKSLLAKFRELLDSPIDCIQLRFKDIADSRVFDMAAGMVDRARKVGLPVLIDDRPEAALALGADGVHLGKADIPPRIARELLGRDAIIGRTTRARLPELELFDGKDVDYVSAGPLYVTPTKPGLRALPHARVKKFIEVSPYPVVGIGAIDGSNIEHVKGLGVRTVAFVRYGITARDTRKKIEELRRFLT